MKKSSEGNKYKSGAEKKPAFEKLVENALHFLGKVL